MSFADLLRNEQQKVEESQGGDNLKVDYPKTKHKRLFYAKGQKELLIQVLPHSSLVGQFALPIRKMFISATTSKGKQLNQNFTLDSEPNPGSLLEQKITEWQNQGMLPNGFGGQASPKRVHLVNVVEIKQYTNDQGQNYYAQERDEHGQLVVRIFEMPHSAYGNLVRKLQDPLLNSSNTDLSFMDINHPAPIKVSKPAPGGMEYSVEVYSTIGLPSLGQGWEAQLEDLTPHAIPTERLENGDEWIKVFIDLKEGRKPGGNSTEAPPAPSNQQNPYGQQQAPPPAQSNPYGQQQQQNTYNPPPAGNQTTGVNQMQQPPGNQHNQQYPTSGQQQQGNGYHQQPTPQQPNVGQQHSQQPQNNQAPQQQTPNVPNQQVTQQPTNTQQQAPQQQTPASQPTNQQQPTQQQQPSNQAEGINLGDEGMGNIDDLLNEELGSL